MTPLTVVAGLAAGGSAEAVLADFPIVEAEPTRAAFSFERHRLKWSCLSRLANQSKALIAVVVGFYLPLTTSAQSTVAPGQTKPPSASTKIAQFFIDKAKPGSGYETGPLHIIYSDGTEVVQRLPPLKATTDQEAVLNAVGFSGVELAQDQRTLGWTVDVEGTSYPIPLSVVLFRDRRVLHTLDEELMVWSWMFVQGGKQVAVVFGPTHGPEVGDYRLYDVKTGKLISEIRGNEDTQALDPNAPDWAKQLQDHLHNQ